MDKKHTIKDIAQLAGVSKGTVDRVLHKRGRVSKKALEKVEKVLKEIDYQANPMARNLKSNKTYKIFVLLPNPKYDPYWFPAIEGIKEAAKEYKPFGVLIENFLYHPYKRASFLEKSKKAIQSEPDALLMVPLFGKESLAIFSLCKKNNILLALFNNYIDALNNENFIGQDLNQSGRLVANLLDKMVASNATIAILHIDEESHMRTKENGFKEYFEEEGARSHTIITYSFSTTSALVFKNKISGFFNNHPTIAAVFVTNSKAHLLVKALDDPSKGGIVVGYDLLNENIELLKEGKIDFLIHQKPKQQAYLGVGNLAAYFLFDKPMPPRNLLPIDIITSENVIYYLN